MPKYSSARRRSGLTNTRELPLALAGIHNRFESIHPFIDGNGRRDDR
ncbi:MAG: Fic family protein [Jatrophihabitans sp.]